MVYEASPRGLTDRPTSPCSCCADTRWGKIDYKAHSFDKECWQGLSGDKLIKFMRQFTQTKAGRPRNFLRRPTFLWVNWRVSLISLSPLNPHQHSMLKERALRSILHKEHLHNRNGETSVGWSVGTSVRYNISQCSVLRYCWRALGGLTCHAGSCSCTRKGRPSAVSGGARGLDCGARGSALALCQTPAMVGAIMITGYISSGQCVL